MTSVVALLVILAALALCIFVGLIMTKRRVKRKLPGQDTHVES